MPAVDDLSYSLHVPPTRGARPPLLVMLHGCRQTPDDFAAGTRMNELADRDGFVVAYPAQSARANPLLCWNWFEAGDQRRDRGEPARIAAITRRVAGEQGIDPGRVCIAGLSAGGAMALILATAYPDLYAAVGVHSGLPYAAAADSGSALAAMLGRPAVSAQPPAARPMPTIVFHGDRDTTVVAANGAAIIEQVRGAARRAGEPLRKSEERREGKGGRSAQVTVYRGPDDRSLAEYWLILGGTHAWSGGSPEGSFTEQSGPDASAEMVRFFAGQRNPLPPLAYA